MWWKHLSIYLSPFSLYMSVKCDSVSQDTLTHTHTHGKAVCWYRYQAVYNLTNSHGRKLNWINAYLCFFNPVCVHAPTFVWVHACVCVSMHAWWYGTKLLYFSQNSDAGWVKLHSISVRALQRTQYTLKLEQGWEKLLSATAELRPRRANRNLSS